MKLYLLGWIYLQQLVAANPDDSIKSKLKIKREKGEGSFVKSAVKELTQLTEQLEKSLESLPELKQKSDDKDDKLLAIASNQVSKFIAPEEVYLTPDAPPQIQDNNIELPESGYIQPQPHLQNFESPSLSFQDSFSAPTPVPVTPLQTSFYQVNAAPPQFYLTPPPPPKAPDNIEQNFHDFNDLYGQEGASLPPPPPGYYDYLNTVFINQGQR